jgi:hypothetical protein
MLLGSDTTNYFRIGLNVTIEVMVNGYHHTLSGLRRLSAYRADIHISCAHKRRETWAGLHERNEKSQCPAPNFSRLFS